MSHENPDAGLATAYAGALYTLACDDSGHRSSASYRPLEKIGEGGMGEVWFAEQKGPISAPSRGQDHQARDGYSRGGCALRIGAAGAGHDESLGHRPGIRCRFDAGRATVLCNGIVPSVQKPMDVIRRFRGVTELFWGFPKRTLRAVARRNACMGPKTSSNWALTWRFRPNTDQCDAATAHFLA